MRKYFVMQHDHSDCGAACLAMVLGHYGFKQPLSVLRQDLRTDINGSSVYAMVITAKKYGLESKALCGTFQEFLEEIDKNNVSFPMVVNIMSDDGYSHFVVLNKYRKGKFYILDPAGNCSYKKAEYLEQRWLGNIICFTNHENVEQTDNTRGRMRKYIAVCQKQSKTIVAVTVISLVISLIGLLGSMMFEYIINGIYSEQFIKGDFSVTSGDDKSIDTVLLELIVNLMPSFAVMIVFIIFLYLLQAIMAVFRNFVLAKMSKKINIPILITFYEHVIKVPFSFFSGRKTGDIITRFSDASSVCQSISDVILSVLIDGILAIVYGIFLFMLSPVLFLIVAINLVLYGIIVYSFRKKIKTNRMEILNCDADVNTFLKESVVGIKNIKQFRYEDIVTNKIFNKFNKLMDKSIDGNIIISLQSALVGFISSTSIILILCIGLWLCIHEKIYVGSLITFYVMMSAFISPVQRLLELQPTIQSITVSAERLEDAFSIKKENIYTENNKKENFESIDNLKISDLKFSYGYSDPIINGLDLDIKKGEKIAVLGSNGCGKTTLANVLTGLLYPDEINIQLNGNALSFEKYKKIAEKVSYIPQESFFFSDTIYNNLTYGIENVDDEKLDNLITKCRLKDYISSLSFGIDSMIEENGNNLSSGTKQKMAIVRALLRDPELIILDEATSNVDKESEAEIYSLLKDISEELAILDISHKIYDYSIYDRVYTMKSGSLVYA